MRAQTRARPSRSWTSAGCTASASGRPRVSVSSERLRPLTFLPASKPLAAAGLRWS